MKSVWELNFVPATLCQNLVLGNLVPGNLVPGYLVRPTRALAQGATRSRHFARNHKPVGMFRKLFYVVLDELMALPVH